MTYTADELRAMPTIRSGPTNDLKIDTGRIRVWIRRGEGSPVITVLRHEDGVWERIGTFRDCLSPACQWLVENPFRPGDGSAGVGAAAISAANRQG